LAKNGSRETVPTRTRKHAPRDDDVRDDGNIHASGGGDGAAHPKPVACEGFHVTKPFEKAVRLR
jgi:hypothetical protein